MAQRDGRRRARADRGGLQLERLQRLKQLQHARVGQHNDRGQQFGVRHPQEGDRLPVHLRDDQRRDRRGHLPRGPAGGDRRRRLRQQLPRWHQRAPDRDRRVHRRRHAGHGGPVRQPAGGRASARDPRRGPRRPTPPPPDLPARQPGLPGRHPLHPGPGDRDQLHPVLVGQRRRQRGGRRVRGQDPGPQERRADLLQQPPGRVAAAADYSGVQGGRDHHDQGHPAVADVTGPEPAGGPGGEQRRPARLRGRPERLRQRAEGAEERRLHREDHRHRPVQRPAGDLGGGRGSQRHVHRLAVHAAEREQPAGAAVPGGDEEVGRAGQPDRLDLHGWLRHRDERPAGAERHLRYADDGQHLGRVQVGHAPELPVAPVYLRRAGAEGCPRDLQRLLPHEPGRERGGHSARCDLGDLEGLFRGHQRLTRAAGSARPTGGPGRGAGLPTRRKRDTMSSYILFLILGLGSGATYAILGQGLVLKYRSAGVVDFAHGAVAMFIAYVFVNLRGFGQLELPVVLIPHQISLNGGAGLSTTLAIVISLLYSAALGFVLYRLVYRPLRNASQLTRVCASVGVMLALQAIAVLNYSTEPVATNPIFPSGSLKISGVTFPQDRLFFTGVVIVISVALALIYRYTRFGLATRAGAENDRGAALTGISATRIASQNWVIATMLAGAAGLLIAPVASLDPTSYTLFIVPALAAALVGRFESFWITALAGLLIGCFQSEINKLITVWTWLPQQGLSDAVPFIVIIVVMAFRSRSVLARGGEAAQKNPSVGRPGSPLASAGACFVGGLILLLLLNNVLRFAFISSLTVTCVALSVVVLTGYVGQVSLAQMSLAGIGGFMLGHISTAWGIGFPWSLLLAGLCAVPVGLVIGLPALRLRGVNLGGGTLGLAPPPGGVLFTGESFTGGTGGLPIPPPRLPGLNLAISSGS